LSGYGGFNNALTVGNFGDSTVDAYDFTKGASSATSTTRISTRVKDPWRLAGTAPASHSRLAQGGAAVRGGSRRSSPADTPCTPAPVFS
jgi:hypothetical protein